MASILSGEQEEQDLVVIIVEQEGPCDIGQEHPCGQEHPGEQEPDVVVIIVEHEGHEPEAPRSETCFPMWPYTIGSAAILISHRDHATGCGLVWGYCLLYLCTLWILWCAPMRSCTTLNTSVILFCVLNMGFCVWGIVIVDVYSTPECLDPYSTSELILFQITFLLTCIITLLCCCFLGFLGTSLCHPNHRQVQHE